MPSYETTVLTVDMDELGDDVDIDLVASHARHGIENIPPKRMFMQSNMPQRGNETLSRPTTAGATALSELEEITLSAAQAESGRPAANRSNSYATQQASSSQREEPPWSPASSDSARARIPSLDEGSSDIMRIPTLGGAYSPPSTPTLGDDRGGDSDMSTRRQSEAENAQQEGVASPTASERAKAEKGCALM